MEYTPRKTSEVAQEGAQQGKEQRTAELENAQASQQNGDPKKQDDQQPRRIQQRQTRQADPRKQQ